MTGSSIPIVDYRPPHATAPAARGPVVVWVVATLVLAAGVGFVVSSLLVGIDVREQYAALSGLGFAFCVCGSVPLLWAVVALLPPPPSRLAYLTQKVIATLLSFTLLVGAVVLVGLVVSGLSPFHGTVPLFGGAGSLLAGIWFGVIGLFVRPPAP